MRMRWDLCRMTTGKGFVCYDVCLLLVLFRLCFLISNAVSLRVCTRRAGFRTRWDSLPSSLHPYAWARGDFLLSVCTPSTPLANQAPRLSCVWSHHQHFWLIWTVFELLPAPIFAMNTSCSWRKILQSSRYPFFFLSVLIVNIFDFGRHSLCSP